MANVTLRDITQRYDKTLALNEISFAVPDGAFWVLVGPSGCGKSTLLRTIAGLDAVQNGELYIGDRLMNTVPARQRDVAMVFQNYALYPHMTVAENLSFGLRMRQQPPARVQDQVQRVARSLAIEHLLERKPKQLSGGQQQRVALGRAIARQPQVFLLDEPLSNLDAQLRDRTRAELKQLHREWGITTLYVTHDQTEAMTLGETIVLLDRGVVQQVGTPSELYAQPANRMVASFIGSPPMNLLPVTYQQGQLQVAQQVLPCPEFLSDRLALQNGDRLDLGLRPEHCHLAAPAETPQLAVIIEVLENLGREILVQGLVVGSSLTWQFYVPTDVGVRVGDRLTVTWDADQLYAFDTETGVAL
ncbi:MAG: ABC transporter ATP-binding protein [Spirulinaceae cyanobacterium]